jgi:hypothetical protein
LIRPLLAAISLLGLAAVSATGANRQTFDLDTLDTLLGLAGPGDTTVASGDMLYRVEDLLRYRALVRPSGGIATRAAIRLSSNLWPGGLVPYRFDASVTPTERSQFVAAAAEWEAVANVHFVPATSETNLIYVISTDNNSSYVGMIGGQQPLNIYNWNYRFIICHEMAHALGVSHEQSRSDRDTYVTINLANIETGQSHNFDKYSDTTNNTPYDFDSIMHYSLYAFSRNGQPTITVKPAYKSAAQTVGQTDHLSRYDIDGMVSLYGGVGTDASLKLRQDPQIIDDNTDGSSGNNNGILDRGETVRISLLVRNTGTRTATSAKVTASETSPYAFFSVSSADLGTLSPGATASTGALHLVVPANTPYGHSIPITFTLSANEGSRQETFTLHVAPLPVPTITPGGGFVFSPQTITLATSLAGGAIRYTLDNTDPTITSPLYSAPFPIAQTTTVRAISVAPDASLSTVASAEFFFVPPSFDASLPFTQSELPYGWQIDVDPSRAGQVSIANGRFEVRETDAAGAIQRSFPLLAHANGFRVAYTGNVADAALGMGNRLEILLADGSEYFVALARPPNDSTAIKLTAGTGDPATLQQNLSPNYGPYRVTAEFRDGSIGLDVRQEGASSSAYTGTIVVPDLAIHELQTIRFVALVTNGEPSWLDNILVTALYPRAVTPLPAPPTAPSLLEATFVPPMRVNILLSGQDSETTQYLVESRSLKRKWSPWRIAGVVTPFGASPYRTSIHVPKALRHQIRVVARNPGGQSTSPAINIKPALAKPKRP